VNAAALAMASLRGVKPLFSERFAVFFIALLPSVY